jgi:hypothetical protein
MKMPQISPKNNVPSTREIIRNMLENTRETQLSQRINTQRRTRNNIIAQNNQIERNQTINNLRQQQSTNIRQQQNNQIRNNIRSAGNIIDVFA